MKTPGKKKTKRDDSFESVAKRLECDENKDRFEKKLGIWRRQSRPKAMVRGWITGTVLALTIVCPAMADEYWLCAYEVNPGITLHPLFQVTANELIHLGGKDRYRLLQNSPEVIVGASSDHFFSPSAQHEISDGTLVLIDKHTGEYREISMLLGKDFDGPFKFRGTCRKGVPRSGQTPKPLK